MITFRPVSREDLLLVHEWHQRPHVKRWWTARDTLEETEEHYVPTIDGSEPTDHYLALLDGEPFGMIQTYLVSDYPDYAALIGEGEGTAGVDLYIADESLTGRGLGTELLRRFVDAKRGVDQGVREGRLPGRARVPRPGRRCAAPARPARAQLMSKSRC